LRTVEIRNKDYLLRYLECHAKLAPH